MNRNTKALLMMLQGIYEQTKAYIQQELQELGNPANPAGKLAAAFALGTLLSFIPVPFMDTLLVGLVLTRFKQVNRAAVFMARLVWNDLLVFPLYGPGYRLGSAVVGPFVEGDRGLLGMGTAVTLTLNFLLGTIILATSLTMAAFGICLVGLKLYRVVRAEANVLDGEKVEIR